MKKYIILAIMALIFQCLHAQRQYATISGTLPFLKDGDSVKIEVYKYPAFMTIRDFITNYSTVIKQHSFSIMMPADEKPRFISLDFGRLDKDIRTLVIYKGDLVRLTEVNGKYNFSGKNSAAYNTNLMFDQIYSRRNAYHDFHDPANLLRNFFDADSTAIDCMNYLRLQRENIPIAVYDLLLANVLSHDLFKGSLAAYSLAGDSSKPGILVSYHYLPNPMLRAALEKLKSDTNALYTQFYLGGIINQYFIDSCFFKGKRFDVSLAYTYLKDHFTGKLRDALVTKLLYNKKGSYLHLTETVENALTFVSSPDFRNVLTGLADHLGKGRPAYNFTLTDEHGTQRHFSDFKDKVVLLDFWYTGCPSCAETAPYIKKIEEIFKGKPVVFISICIDKYEQQWKKSLLTGRYTGPYSTNLFTDGLMENNPVITYYQVTSYPGLLLIGKDGKLCNPLVDPRSDNAAGTIAAINSQL